MVKFMQVHLERTCDLCLEETNNGGIWVSFPIGTSDLKAEDLISVVKVNGSVDAKMFECQDASLA